MLVCALFTTIAHETAGAARIRHSLRPLFSRGRENYLQTSGASYREIAKVRLAVIASEATHNAVVPAQMRNCASGAGTHTPRPALLEKEENDQRVRQ